MARQIAASVAISGAGTVLHHRLSYGRWYDKNSICHGKIGLFLIIVGLLVLGLN